MSDPVEISVRSALKKVIDELQSIHDKADDTSEAFKRVGKEITEATIKSTKETETFVSNIRGFVRRMADQIKGDFSSLMSLNALSESLRFSNMMRGSVEQTIELSNAIRKLGPVFGIASEKFRGFQNTLTKGLGDIGLSSDVAARALEGLSKTQVRGETNLVDYAKTSGMLASVTRQQGAEGDIAKLMADTITARGGNPNDMKAMNQMAESLRKIFLSTGAVPTESLQAMRDIFLSMPKDLRKSITDAGLVNLATASAVAGPSATKFIEDYLSQSPIERMAFEAQGGKGIFNNKGIDIEKFAKFARDITSRIGGDPRMAAKTLGLSDEAAEGFIRLAENLDRVAEAQQKINKTTGDLNKSYRESMGLGEAFKANINKVKSTLAKPLSWITQKTTDALSGAAETTAGSAGVVATSAIGAALLAGGGLRGIGKGLGRFAKGSAEEQVREAITGEKAIPVKVVNFSEMPLGGVAGTAGALTKSTGLLSMLGTLGLAIGGKFLGEGAADILFGAKEGEGEKADAALSAARGEVVDKVVDSAQAVGFDVFNQIKGLLQDISNKLSPDQRPSAMGQGGEVRANIKVETQEKNLKVTHQPARGARN